MLEYYAAGKMVEDEKIKKIFSQYFSIRDDLISSLKALCQISTSHEDTKEIFAKKEIAVAEMKKLSRQNNSIHAELDALRLYSNETIAAYKRIARDVCMLVKDFEKESNSFNRIKEHALKKLEEGLVQKEEEMQNIPRDIKFVGKAVGQGVLFFLGLFVAIFILFEMSEGFPFTKLAIKYLFG